MDPGLRRGDMVGKVTLAHLLRHRGLLAFPAILSRLIHVVCSERIIPSPRRCCGRARDERVAVWGSGVVGVVPPLRTGDRLGSLLSGACLAGKG